MGPLAGLNIISTEFNYILAFIIGIAFGYILEQAGFSSSRKLAGLFYGYDFVVLKVFFTAAITTMIGLIVFESFGLVDMNFVYINPTYLWSAIVGGVIMGAGFITGGFCSGTSFCGASIGKIDAMFFILGLFVGVFIFTEVYQVFESLYFGGFLGNIKVFDSLGMSQGVFALLLIGFAIFAFIVTARIEKNVNKQPTEKLSKNFFHKNKRHVLVAALAIIFGIVLIFLPDRKTKLFSDLSDEEYIENQNINYITCDEVAYRIIDDDKFIQLIDLRSEEESEKFTLPGSINIPFEMLTEREWADYLDDKRKKNVYFCNDEVLSKKAFILADRLGYRNNFVLKGGLNKFSETIMQVKYNPNITSNQERDSYRFRKEASVKINELIKNAKTHKVKPKKIKKVEGGCG